MNIDKYRIKERRPVALRFSGNAVEEIGIENEPATQNTKTGVEPSSWEKPSAT